MWHCFISCVFLIALLCPSIGAASVFSSQEVQKIKKVIHEMASILEGNHREILELEQILATAGTPLRKARVKDRVRVKTNSFMDRLKDLRAVRSSFLSLNSLKEFMISVDDRLKIMEENIALIQDIYFPKALEIAGDSEDDDYPTFINPGDPRYQMDEDQEKLAASIQKTRNLMGLKDKREANESAQRNFDHFVGQLDVNLKAEDKPLRRLTPVLGHQSLDDFHHELEDSQAKDPTHGWNESLPQREFRQFFHEIESLDRQPLENQRIVTGFPSKDLPAGPRSRKTFQELVEQLQVEARAVEAKKIVLGSQGVQAVITGINSFVNETRLDLHRVSPKQFGEFFNEMEPIRSEVVLSYQKGVIKKSEPLRYKILKKATRLAAEDRDGVFFDRLRERRVFQQGAPKKEFPTAEFDHVVSELDFSKSRAYQPKSTPVVTETDFARDIIRQTSSIDWVNRAMTFLERLRDSKVFREHGALEPKISSEVFSKFMGEMEPVPSEVILSYRKALLGREPMLEDVLPPEIQLKPETLHWIDNELTQLESLRTRAVIQDKGGYQTEIMNSYLEGLESRVVNLAGKQDFHSEKVSVQAYVDKFNRSVGGYPYARDMALVPKQKDDSNPEAKDDLPRKKLIEEQTLIPVSVQLMDDDRVVFAHMDLEFELVLPVHEPKITGKILEASDLTPFAVSLKTDSEGEVQVHLLMTLHGKEIQVGREIIQDNNRIICRIQVHSTPL
jgi:hypothetical protein